MKALLLLTIMTISADSLAGRHELPFHEPVKVAKININKPMYTNFLNSYKELNLEGKKKIERKIALQKN